MTHQLTTEQQTQVVELAAKHNISHEVATIAVLSGVENAGDILAKASTTAEVQQQQDADKQKQAQIDKLVDQYKTAKKSADGRSMIQCKNALASLGVRIN